MKKLIGILSIMLLLLGIGSAGATIITFDDIIAGNGVWIEDGYAGFDWENMAAVKYNVYDGTSNAYNGYKNGVISYDNVAFNSSGTMAITSSGNDFNFNGAYFTSAWYDDNVLTLKGYDDGVLKFTKQVGLYVRGPQWVVADFTSIDQLVFETSHQQFAMDNFTFNSAVPEPATLLLLGLGLLGVAGLRRKK